MDECIIHDDRVRRKWAGEQCGESGFEKNCWATGRRWDNGNTGPAMGETRSVIRVNVLEVVDAGFGERGNTD